MMISRCIKNMDTIVVQIGFLLNLAIQSDWHHFSQLSCLHYRLGDALTHVLSCVFGSCYSEEK